MNSSTEQPKYSIECFDLDNEEDLKHLVICPLCRFTKYNLKLQILQVENLTK